MFAVSEKTGIPIPQSLVGGDNRSRSPFSQSLFSAKDGIGLLLIASFNRLNSSLMLGVLRIR